MTNDSDTNGRTGRPHSSRRTFLAGAVGTPALLGLAVGSYEAASRVTSDEEFDTCLVCDLADGQDNLAEDPTSISADPRLLSAHDLSVGDQLRITRSDDQDEFAVYTIADEQLESPETIVRMSDSARCRLDLGSVATDPDDESCPGPTTSCSISDEEFDGDISTMISNPALSESEARERGELIEQLDENGTDTIFIAPHGGGVQPKTDEQAEHAAELGNATCWRTKGWGPNSGAFQRWYVPTTELSPESYPELETIADADFDVAVDFGGVCEQGVVVAGNATASLLEDVRDSINDALPSCAEQATLPDDEAVTGEGLLVDDLGDECLFLSQSYATRRAYWEEIATGTAAALSDDFEVAESGSCR
ncbi:poly-gamma-glutamate hydrolase family protein [Halostagnicola bangensis]